MFQPSDTIVCIGDSITHAHRRPEEMHDCYYLGCGFVKMIAARLNADRPQLRLNWINRGECGQNIADLAKRWERDCLEHRPAVISVLMGINDANPHCPHASKPDVFKSICVDLLERTRTALPEAQLILMEPFGLPVPPPQGAIGEDYMKNLRAFQPIVKQVADEFRAVFVPLQDAFDQAMRTAPASHWALDGVHPSAAGHLLIARRWLSRVVPDYARD